MLKKLLVGISLLLAAPTLAQTVQQSGTVTRNHAPVWIASGVVGDGGSSADSPISSMGVTNDGGAGFCVSSGRQTAAGRNQLCFGAASNGPATISLQNFGTASPQSLQFVVNGTTYPFPGSLANITIGVTPVVGGTNSLCLYVSGGVVGQQACTLSAITSLTGDVTATGPGVSVSTLAASGVVAGTYGSATVTPVITVNAKGLVTAVTTTAAGVTVGSTVVTSGTNNGLLYDNGSVLGNLATLASGVLVTSAGSVPSISTTLPSGLTVGGVTFTGTETFPDAATWTSTGISKVAALSVGSATLPTGGNVSVSGLYQINGTQISATSALSDGKTGSGSLVGATSPAIAGTWTGSPTFSGNITFSGQALHTGTALPASASGNTVVVGTTTSQVLSNTGQALFFNSTSGGAVIEGDGSSFDVTLVNKSAGVVFGIPTGTTKLQFPSLASGTCSSGLGLDAGNNTILISCPGAAGSIQVGTTTVTSGTNNNVLTSGTGTLANVTIASLLTQSGLVGISGTTNATINVPAAVKSDQTTASSTTVAVVPGVQQFHPSAVKAWGSFVGSSGATNSAYNMTAVRNSAGNYTLTFGTAFSTANYACVAATIWVAGSFNTSGVLAGFTPAAQLAGSIGVQTFTLAAGNADPTTLFVQCEGTQ